MDKNKYINMTSDLLYEHLLSDAFATLPDNQQLVDELICSERYQKDYEFRAYIDTAKALIFFFHRKSKSLIPLCTDIIERASALKIWKLVAINWNLLGNAYFMVDAFEHALSCYQHVIKIEANHNLSAITSVAYHNIALIYFNLEAHKKSYEYFSLALNSLESVGPNQPRYLSKLILYLSNLSLSLCQINRVNEVPPLLERIKKLNSDNKQLSISYSYHIANMYYSFYTGNYEEARKSYQNGKVAILKNDSALYLDFLYFYISLCDSFQLDYDFYIKDLLSVQSLALSERLSIISRLYRYLRKYYQSIENIEEYEKTTHKYIEILEKNANDIRMKQLNSLSVINDLLQHNENLSKITTINSELKQIAEEANRHKNALHEAYHRIEMINELGQKMTSSLKFHEVIELIYQIIKQNIPLTSFILMVIDSASQQLHTVAYYKNNKLQPDLSISLDNPNSVLIECYKQNKLILSDNIQTDERFKMRTLLQLGKTKMRSAIYMPLNVGNQLIGTCSVQYKKANMYTTKHTLFLKQLMPYLSISLNNAIRSQKLEYEIRSHLKTRVKLEKANHRLELLSALDGLTQISSRRDFEIRVLDLICNAKIQKKTVALFMCDIDNFKLYNDTYGHLEGDEALKKIAKVIHYNLEKVYGLSARFGGEEFICACCGLNMTQAQQLANQIRQEIYNLKIENIKAPLGQITISIGIALAKNLDISQKSEMMHLADTSLYQAKKDGKNKVVLKKMNS